METLMHMHSKFSNYILRYMFWWVMHWNTLLSCNVKLRWSPDGLKKKKKRHSKVIRDNLGQMRPTDPRHSWWKRNRCYESPEDFHAWTLGSESEARILLSERSCPPFTMLGRREERERESSVSQWYWGTDPEVRLTGWKWKKQHLSATSAMM